MASLENRFLFEFSDVYVSIGQDTYLGVVHNTERDIGGPLVHYQEITPCEAIWLKAKMRPKNVKGLIIDSDPLLKTPIERVDLSNQYARAT